MAKDPETRAHQEWLGYVQPVGKEPAGAWPGQTHEYGSGALLLAGSEMVKLAPVDLSSNGR